MSIDELVEHARNLPPAAVAALGAAAAFLVVLAIGVQLSVSRLRRQLEVVEEELVDRTTGLLPRSALRVRMGAELAWAATSSTPVAVAALRIRGSRFTQAARALRHSMREEESAFLIGDQRVVVELWGAGPEEAAVAVRRLGEDLARAGHPVVDVGLACAPRDGGDVETLVGIAQRDLRPVDDPQLPGHDVGGDGRARSASGHTAALLRGVLPWFAAMALVLLAAWRLLPAAIEPTLAGTRAGSDLVLAMIAVVGLPMGAALVHASCWNLGGGAAPSSQPIGRAGLRMTAAIALLVAVPLAWGVLAPDAPTGASVAFGASLAMLVLVVLVLLHGRQLVHAPPMVLVGLLAIGAAVTWACVDAASLPVVANGGRLLAAGALGALLASFVERASWIVGLAALAGIVDVWSVYSDSGVTNRVLESAANGDGDRLLELLLFTGPIVDGSALFEIGVTDLVFLALFMAWAHDWRVDMRVAGGALLAACWCALVVGELRDDAIPMLPFLSAAIVLVVAARSLRLRGRVRRWRAGGEAAGPAPVAGVVADVPPPPSTI
jgi:hypothetical protein